MMQCVIWHHGPRQLLRHIPMIIPPAALLRTTAGCIWEGICKMQPVHPMRDLDVLKNIQELWDNWLTLVNSCSLGCHLFVFWIHVSYLYSVVSHLRGWSEGLDAFVIAFTSDAAPANMKMSRWLGRNLPKNTLLTHHTCNAYFSGNFRVIINHVNMCFVLVPVWFQFVVIVVICDMWWVVIRWSDLLLRHESHHCVDDMWRGMNINSQPLVHSEAYFTHDSWLITSQGCLIVESLFGTVWQHGCCSKSNKIRSEF